MRRLNSLAALVFAAVAGTAGAQSGAVESSPGRPYRAGARQQQRRPGHHPGNADRRHLRQLRKRRLRPDCCQPACGPAGTFWVEADYLLWFLRGAPVPPLVTASVPGTPRSAAGVLGVPTTTTLFGGNSINGNSRSGLLIRAGTWLNDCHTFGIEGNFFFLGNNAGNGTFSGTSDAGAAPISRPFTNALTGLPAAELVSFPGVLNGSVNVSSSSNFSGGGLNARCNLCCDCSKRIDLLVGYSYLRLTEDLVITESLQSTSPTIGAPAGTLIGVQDRFRTENVFNGVSTGLAGEWWFGKLFFDARALVAVGDLQRIVTIGGTTAVTLPGMPQVARPGGLLAQSTNSGRYVSDTLGVSPQLNLNVGYQLTQRLRATVGYSFLYLNRVARPGDQIDGVVDPRLLTPGAGAGATRPAYDRKDSDFWAQGVNFGLQYRY